MDEPKHEQNCIRFKPNFDMEEITVKSGEATSLSSISSPIGRAMHTVLNSRPKHLEAAISRSGSGHHRSSEASLDESLHFLLKYARDTVEINDPLHQILIPMIEHSLKFKSSKACQQVLLLLTWLSQDEELFPVLSSDLTEIFIYKDDNYIALGWCILIRSFVEHEMIEDHISESRKQEMHKVLLKHLSRSMPRVSSFICKQSILQEGFELPSRLAVAGADCLLAFSVALAQKTRIPKILHTKTEPFLKKQLITHVPDAKDVNSEAPKGLIDEEMGLLFLENLNFLILLIPRLQAWNKKSRPLHAKGLAFVLELLQDIKRQYGSAKIEADDEMLMTGLCLLSSCWKQYGMLLCLEIRTSSEHYRDLLDQYISGIEFCSKCEIDEHPTEKDGGREAKKFFLTCLCLLLGRLGNKLLEIAISVCGQRLLHILLAQLQSPDEDVVNLAITILRAVFFKMDFCTAGASECDPSCGEEFMPLLLNLLDERDTVSRAVVVLLAEYCLRNCTGQCFQDISKRLDCGDECQRRNALDVILEIFRISSCSGRVLPKSLQVAMVKRLLACLEIEDPVINMQASHILPLLDPHSVLPALVGMFSPDERTNSSTCDALVEVLKIHSKSTDVIIMFLDCLSEAMKFHYPSGSGGLGSTLLGASSTQTDTNSGIDQIFSLVPAWAESVKDWSHLVGPLIEKMLAEPSNAIIVRFLAHISEYMAEAADDILHRILLCMEGQYQQEKHSILPLCQVRGLDEEGNLKDVGAVKLKGSLFDRLCPLLVLRLLPLRVFSSLDSSLMYGSPRQCLYGVKIDNVGSYSCVASILLYRALDACEFEDVRKLAAELCGRLHPQVLIPVMLSHLEDGVQMKDLLKLKACLFSICTSLVVRGHESSSHPAMIEIRRMLEIVLLWPSHGKNEVCKAQHGCIDCLALMICADLENSESSAKSICRSSVLNYVLDHLTCAKYDVLTSNTTEDRVPASVSHSFRLCMANVLISASQKISDSRRHLFVEGALHRLIQSVKVTREIISVQMQVMANSEIRVACLQILFAAVYHLKSAVLPLSSDLFKLSIQALERGSEKEKLASVKLMASLMASEDAVLESIAAGLLEARQVLGNVMVHSSPELQKLCQKLLLCITPSD